MNLTVADMDYPILCVWDRFIDKVGSYEAFTLTTSVGVKNGMFRGMLIVDSSGAALRLKEARKLHGVGFLWGYHPDYGQKIKIEPIVDGVAFVVSVDEVRRLVFRSFRLYSGWSTQFHHEERRRKIKEATTVREIIAAL